jgi:hypothetical protein
MSGDDLTGDTRSEGKSLVGKFPKVYALNGKGTPPESF